MCGIAGFLQRTSDDVLARARCMAAAMGHRGPDGEGVFEIVMAGWNGALAHRRLAIIDLSEDGHQPMIDDETGVTLIYNGELYNYRDVRRDLEARSVRFQSKSDTEVLLRAYLEWGAKSIERFDGMFAFALWDPRSQVLLLARDRFGIKPLYYHQRPGQSLVFASEVRTILSSGLVPREIDMEALPGYLETGSAVSPATLVLGVCSLPPGCTAEWRDGTLRTTRYWDLADAIGGAPPTREEFADCLTRAVEAEMVSDVPIGLFLSGGIDSSALVAILSKGDGALHTVSLAFEEAAFDERAHARIVSENFGTTHREILVSADHVATSLPHLAEWQDLPSVDGLNTYLVSRAARESGLTVALSGLGGDELFAGYNSFRYAQSWSQKQMLLRAVPFRGSLARVGEGLGGGWVSKLLRLLGDAASIEDLYALTREVIPPTSRAALLGRNAAAQSKSAAPLNGGRNIGPVDAMTLLETGRYMLDTTLRQADIMSMAVSLEVRVPLLNHRLAELAIRTPSEWRLGEGVPKPLLVNSLPRPLPNSIVHRRKGTFTLPFASWMRGPYRPFVEEILLAQRTRERGLFADEAVRQLWQEFHAGRVRWSHVWALVALEGWCRANLDASVPAAAIV
ncbi:MAG: asparagine synthase (glutamine-hydrolyzing) [Gemmatimonadaceae bacterium]